MFPMLSFVLLAARHFGWNVFQGAIGLLRRGTMRPTILNRIVLVVAIVTVSLVGMSIRTNAMEQQQQNQKQKDTKKQKDSRGDALCISHLS